VSSLILATEALEKLDLVGQLRGIFVVVFAIGLFCGSVYLLLATNVGTKIGFLVAFAALTGFISMLGMIWSTSQFPLNSLHGPQPAWHVRQVVDNTEEAAAAPVRSIAEDGRTADTAVAGEIKAAVDTALTAEGGEFAQFTATTDYLTTDTKEVGGGSNGPLRKKALYSVVEIREVLKVEALPGQAPPRPRADPDKPPRYVVLVRDLGALRLPQYFTVVAFAVLFVISLVLLHRAERAGQAKVKGTDVEPKPALA